MVNLARSSRDGVISRASMSEDRFKTNISGFSGANDGISFFSQLGPAAAKTAATIPASPRYPIYLRCLALPLTSKKSKSRLSQTFSQDD